VTIAFPFWLYKVVTKEKHRKGFWKNLGCGVEGGENLRFHIGTSSLWDYKFYDTEEEV